MGGTIWLEDLRLCVRLCLCVCVLGLCCAFLSVLCLCILFLCVFCVWACISFTEGADISAGTTGGGLISSRGSLLKAPHLSLGSINNHLPFCSKFAIIIIMIHRLYSVEWRRACVRVCESAREFVCG